MASHEEIWCKISVLSETQTSFWRKVKLKQIETEKSQFYWGSKDGWIMTIKMTINDLLIFLLNVL